MDLFHGRQEILIFNTNFDIFFLENMSNKLECDKCGSFYKSRKTIIVHLLNKHGDGHICEFCGKKFQYRKSFKVHQRSVHRAKADKRFMCDDEDCGFVGTTKRDLNHHKAHAHGYVGLTKQRLATAAVTRASPALKFSCNMCSAAFNTANKLSMHLRNHK